MKERKEPDYKRQLKGKSKELAGLPRPEMRKAKAVKDARFFDPDKYKGDAAWLFPCLPEIAKKIGKVAATVALCLFAFVAPAQNRVTLMNISTKYVEFTWQGDTVNNVEFTPFFLALDYQQATAERMSNELTNSLLMRPTAVDEISGDMARTLFGVSFDQYVCFFHIREYRARVVKR